MSLRMLVPIPDCLGMLGCDTTVSTQRRQRRLLETTTDTDVVPLSAERAKKLEDIGFEWSAVPSSHKSWDGRYDELCEFVVRGSN
jgi:hypothetical protein